MNNFTGKVDLRPSVATKRLLDTKYSKIQLGLIMRAHKKYENDAPRLRWALDLAKVGVEL